MRQELSPLGVTQGALVAVAPTATTLLDAFPTTKGQYLAITVSNDDALQTESVWLETSPNGSTLWSEPVGIGMDTIQPQTSRVARIDIGGYLWVRIRATMSGAGGDSRYWTRLLEDVR